MAFQVFDNGKPADTGINGAMCNAAKGRGWDNSRFETKAEAYEYALKWLGEAYSPNLTLAQALEFSIFDTPYEYNAYEDTIKVKEVN